MTTYLQFDGVDDYLKTPLITFTKIEIDFAWLSDRAAYRFLVDARPGLSGGIITTYTNDEYGAGFKRVYVDNVQKTSNTKWFTSGQRCLLRGEFDTATTDDIDFFRSNGGGNYESANVYSIKLYNGASLVAFYDMTIGSQVTGKVQDQSGNGYHATLTGGTWVSDGGGVTGTTYTGSGNAQGTSNVTANGLFIANSTGSAQGITDVSAITNAILSAMGTAQGASTVSGNEIKSFAASGNAQGQSNVTANELIIYLASGTVNGQSSITANDTVITHNGTVYSESGSAQGVTEITVNERQILSAKGTAQGVSNVSANDLIVLMVQGIAEGYSTVTVVDSSMQIIGRVELKGQRDLYVYLQGRRDLRIDLKGSL